VIGGRDYGMDLAVGESGAPGGFGASGGFVASAGFSASGGSGATGPATRGLRDGQRARVYDAENLVHRIFDRSAEFPVVEVAGSRLTLPVERHFAAIESVQTYVDAVLAMAPVRAGWPRAVVPVLVRQRGGARPVRSPARAGAASVAGPQRLRPCGIE